MSQPCLSKPKGCPAEGPASDEESSQNFGSVAVKSDGKSARSAASVIMNAAIQKVGRRRRRFQASPHMDEGAPSSATASTAPRPVSSMSET